MATIDKQGNECRFLIPHTDKEYFLKRVRIWGKQNYQHYRWRDEKNIFRILLTEICLQKTDSQKVDQLYYLLRQFSSPRDVLKKPRTFDVIVSRIGLKYKKERILRICHQLIESFGGQVPGNYKELVGLHGVGDYIANAVLSFGFKKRTALVDTNTIRILGSFFGFRSNKKRPRDDRRINHVLLTLLPVRNHVIFNYYLLDFGAMVCTASKKLCDKCLLRYKCNFKIWQKFENSDKQY